MGRMDRATSPAGPDAGGLFASPLAVAFDTACQLGRDGTWTDLAAATGHDRFAGLDYARVGV